MAKRREKWYNSKEAAEYLNLSVGHLQRLCRQRQITFRKLKGYHFTKAMLDDFLKARTEQYGEYPKKHYRYGVFGPRR